MRAGASTPGLHGRCAISRGSRLESHGCFPEGGSSFTQAVIDDHECGERVGPPPPEGGVQDEPDQHRDREQTVDDRHPRLGFEHTIAERSTGAGLAVGEREHRERCKGEPGDPEQRVVWPEADGKDDERLGTDVEREQHEGVPDQASRRRSRRLFSGGRGSSQTAERRAQQLIAASYALLVAYIGVEAIRDLAGSHHPVVSWVGIGLAAFTAPTMPLLARAKRNVGRKLNSSATVSEAGQNMICAYLSVALLVGLLANALLGWWWADPAAALVIAAVAAREGVESWRGDSCDCC